MSDISIIVMVSHVQGRTSVDASESRTKIWYDVVACMMQNIPRGWNYQKQPGGLVNTEDSQSSPEAISTCGVCVAVS